jgi:hypothetical protein
MSIEHHVRQESGHRRRVTAILGNVHEDVVTSTVTSPSAGTGSPTPGSATPSTGGSLQMVAARQRQPRENPPLCTAGADPADLADSTRKWSFCARWRYADSSTAG